MSNYEFQIQTPFGPLTIHFDNSEEFVERLNSLDIEAMTAAIEKHLSDVIVALPRQIKPVLSEICDFTPGGTLEFIQIPKDKVGVIGLTLFAFDPDPLDPPTVAKIASVKNPTAYLLNKAYKQYFEKVDRGLYRLTHNGRLWVTEEVIPELISKPEQGA